MTDAETQFDERLEERLEVFTSRIIMRGWWAIGAFTVAYLVAVLSVGIWVGELQQQVQANSTVIEKAGDYVERQARSEATLDAINERTRRIEQQIDAILSSRRAQRQ